MTNKEFNSQFDIFYNNIASNAAPSVDFYEKSVFLTQAQRDIIVGLYNGRSFPGVSFESTEEVRKYLSNLSKQVIISPQEEDVIKLPEDLWFTTQEECTFDDDSLGCSNGGSALVIPVKLDDLYKILENPFRGPSKKRVLRVDVEGGVKLYSKYKIKEYKVHYIQHPNPIILEDLNPYNLSIEGISNESETNVNPVLHRAILEEGVRLAKIAYTQ